MIISMGEGKGSLVSAPKRLSLHSSLTQQQSIRSSLTQQQSIRSSLTQQQSLHSLTQQQSLHSLTQQLSTHSSLTQQQSLHSSLTQQLSTHSSLTQQLSTHSSLTQQLSSTSTDEGWILKHINGYATSGQMTAILGARFGRRKGLSRSGAGKTTLLSILCGRNTGYTGTFRINGREVNDASLR